MRFLITICDS